VHTSVEGPEGRRLAEHGAGIGLPADSVIPLPFQGAEATCCRLEVDAPLGTSRVHASIHCADGEPLGANMLGMRFVARVAS
jgi:hypothetical protein